MNNTIIDALNDLPPTVEITGTYIVDSIHGAKYSDAATHRPVAYIVNPALLTVEDARDELEYWLNKRETEPFYIGDFLRTCLDLGEEYADILPSEDDQRFSNIGKLYKWVSISRQYPDIAQRARYIRYLSYSHYAEVAYVPEPLRDNLLRWAVETKASTKELRAKRNEYLPDDNNGLNFIQSSAGVIEAYSLSSDDVRGLLDGSKPKIISIDGINYRVKLERVD